MTEISRMIRCLASVLTLTLLVATPAAAASSAWTDGPGGRVRLVTSGPVRADGTLRGALQIDLKPGWKTYWRDPGSSGVPPQIDISPSGDWSSAVIDFPAPQRHNDESGAWAGYDYPVSLPVLLQAPQGKSPTKVTGSVFLGVCEKICVPLQAPIDLTIDAASTPAEDNAIVDAAWAALPAPASAEFGVTTSSAVNDAAVGQIVSGTVKAPAKIVDFFLAGEDGYLFGDTWMLFSPDKTLFSVKIVSHPKTPPTGAGLRYTLVTEQGAVSGVIPYP